MTIAPGASADTTHPYLVEDFVPGTFAQPQAVAVDSDGNVLVWDNATHALGKFAPDGTPVDFSALGSNILDGSGGFHCATTPADCDRVPTAGITDTLGPGPHNEDGNPDAVNDDENGNLLAVDHSGGPTDGYIYVSNRTDNDPPDTNPGVVEVFAPSGAYIGELNLAAAGPRPANGLHQYGVDVDANGHVYVLLSENGGDRGTVDQFAPIDGDPTHDVFVGQMRLPDQHTPYSDPRWMVASPQFTYLRRAACGPPVDDGLCWFRFPASQYSLHSGLATPDPPPAPFGSSGLIVNEFGVNYYFKVATLDDATGDVYLPGGNPFGVEQRTADDQPIGPRFGRGRTGDPYYEYQLGSFDTYGDVTQGGASALAIDDSTTATAGRIYAKGKGSTIAAFGPPTILPVIHDVTFTAGHTTAHITATIDWGPSTNNSPYCTFVSSALLLVSFGHANCVHSAPFVPEESTQVSVDLTDLTPEHDYDGHFLASDSPPDLHVSVDNVSPELNIHTHAVLGLTTGEADSLSPHGAKLHGSLDADGMSTTYYFEYGLDTNYGQSTSSGSVGGGGVATVAPATLGGLQAGRIYHYRLVATNSLGTSYGEDRSFRAPIAPAIATEGARNISATSADLIARIDPGGSPTTYRFEYGTTPDYGSVTPVPDGSLGSPDTPSVAQVHLRGLRDGVTYHFRVIATNKWGTTMGEDTSFDYLPPSCPNALARQLGGASYLPDCRAYELVSPARAGGVQLLAGDGVSDYAELPPNVPQNAGLSGSSARFAFYATNGTLPGLDAPNVYTDLYVAHRTDAGWVSGYPGIPGSQALVVGDPHCSAALDRCYDFHLTSPTSVASNYDGTDSGSSVAYLWDPEGNSLGRLPSGSLPGDASSYIGDRRASADFSRFAFSSQNVSFLSGGRTSAPGSVYDNDVAAGTLGIASLLPSGAPIPKDDGPPSEYLKIPALSANGSHILMSVAHGVGVHLYMRVDGTVTYDISGNHAVTLAGTSGDGSHVYFTSPDRITSDDHDSSVDLYMWSEATDSIARISKGDGNGDTDACSTAFVGDTCDVSLPDTGVSTDNYSAAEDAAIYFYSPESLDPDNPGLPNARNLYLYRDGAVRLVATLEDSKPIERIQVAPDGAHAALLTASELSGYESAGHEEMYSYDADSGVMRCVSCLPSGDPPTSDVRASASGLFMANDGRSFFATKDSLLEKDTDGLTDVYEFVAARPQLISTGTGTEEAWGGGTSSLPAQVVGLEAVSGDGTDVYFSSLDPLLSADGNGRSLRFYDARTNGGFLEQSANLSCAAAEECRDPGSSSPAAFATVTGAELGFAGNAQPAPVNPHRGKRHKRGQARHFRKHHRKRGRGRWKHD